MKKPALDHRQLYQPCKLENFHFQHSDELDDIGIFLGQDRAVDSILFGLQIAHQGYNVFAFAPAGTGKLSTIHQLVNEEAAKRPSPPDWCYVNNFSAAAKPSVIRFESGRGKEFQEDMEQLIDELAVAIPAAFEGDEYRSKTQEIEQTYRQRELEEINQLRQEAAQAHIVLTETQTGYAFAPVDEENNLINAEQFNQLTAEKQEQYQQKILKLQQRLQKLLNKFPAWRKETKRKIQQLNRTVAALAVNHSISELKQKYAQQPQVLRYLDDVDNDILKHVRDFIPHREQSAAVPFADTSPQSSPFVRYQVNLIISNGQTPTAPVVLEDHPNYANLLGRLDHQAYMGTLVTDFTMIKPGALHRANGGYLVMDARKLLLQPYAWECLKRVLQSREIRMESLERSLSLINTSSLEPEPIPLDIKVVLFGDRQLYYLLNRYDPEFLDLFKVAADFDDSVEREPHELDYARLIATLARREKLRPFNVEAVARLIEQSSRLSGDAEKLSTHLRSLKDLLNEADHWAQHHGHDHVTGSDVEQAIEQKIRRHDRIREKIYEHIRRGTLMIDTDKRVIGQINGLSVLQIGDFMFGQPARITATTRLGNGKVIDIERETELGGAIHSKGVLILSGFIASRYARNTPFSLTASLVFEQSYGQVEGDSASLAELCVILSSLAEVPLRQDLAITGSVNQLGQVQPIGGVNEKIEGFFDVCRQKGLSGNQGVIVPSSNVQALMLRSDVVQAVKDQQFYIYCVETVDQALEYLTGLSAGTTDAEGVFPAGTFNQKVQTQLASFNTLRQRFSAGNQ